MVAHHFSNSENATVVTDNLLFIEDRFARFNICHFLLDKIPRAVLQSTRNRLHGRTILFQWSSYAEYFLNRIGIQLVNPQPKKKTRITYKIEGDIYICNSSFKPWLHPCHDMHPQATKLLYDFMQRRSIGLFRKAVSGLNRFRRPRRILVDRGNTERRKVVNWDDVVKVADEFGFRVVDPGMYRPEDQAAMFSNASVICGVHGAGLTNLVFGTPDTRILELLPPFVASQSYWKASRGLGMQYDALICDDPEFSRPNYHEWSHSPKYNHRPLVVNVEEFARFLGRNLEV